MKESTAVMESKMDVPCACLYLVSHIRVRTVGQKVLRIKVGNLLEEYWTIKYSQEAEVLLCYILGSFRWDQTRGICQALGLIA